jgi:hypothetical protein
VGSGNAGSVEWTEPGYAETDQRETGNRMFTDYGQAVKETRRQAFDNGKDQ